MEIIRGLQIVNSSDLYKVTATDQQGQKQHVSVQSDWFYLSAFERMQMYIKCPPVLGVVTSRANRVASLDFSIVPERSIEDRIVSELRLLKIQFFEQPDSGQGLLKRMSIFVQIKKVLPDIFPDLSNFDNALRRWSTKIKNTKSDQASEIKSWMRRPSPGTLWTDHVKKVVQDLMIHSRVAMYKQIRDNRLENVHVLAGGSVFPITEKHVGGPAGYVQFAFDTSEFQLFFTNEVSFGQYMPNSSLNNGITPLDSLVNLVAENLLFSELMADKADGSRPPEKVLVMTYDDPDSSEGEGEEGVDPEEARRVENKLNRKKKDAGIALLTGYGKNVTVLDLTRSETLQVQMERQKEIDRYVALAFNASQAEINETGSSGTSGRSTSESQERSDNSKGVRPLLNIIEEMYSYEILPQRFGEGWIMQFEEPRSDEDKVSLAKMKLESGAFSVNEVRADDFSDDPYPEEEFNRPQKQGVSQAVDTIAQSINASK